MQQEQQSATAGCAAESRPLSDRPGELLPREKLAECGRAALTDEELIAIFLRTGLPGCNVLELAALLKRRAGSLAALGTLEAADITALCKGIGPAKAATLAAVFELGRRAARESLSARVLRAPAAVYEYMVDELRYMNQERLFVLFLNTRSELIRRVELGRGTLTRLILHPRDVFREAVRANAAAFILVHNHPSGHTEPSESDILMTDQIAAAAKIMRIPLQDHVIIGAPLNGSAAFYSFREHGLLGEAEP